MRPETGLFDFSKTDIIVILHCPLNAEVTSITAAAAFDTESFVKIRATDSAPILLGKRQDWEQCSLALSRAGFETKDLVHVNANNKNPLETCLYAVACHVCP